MFQTGMSVQQMFLFRVGPITRKFDGRIDYRLAGKSVVMISIVSVAACSVSGIPARTQKFIHRTGSVVRSFAARIIKRVVKRGARRTTF
jgi:hypothetical protein